MNQPELAYRRAWARIAGLMFWLVFLFDFAGMRYSASATGHWLSLIGGLLTIPLALGLWAAVAPVHSGWANAAVGFRLFEIALTLLSVLAGFPAVRFAWSGSAIGAGFLQLAQWGDSTSFAAFVFTMGSTIFFALFLYGRLIPRILSSLGVFASVLAWLACLVHLLRPPFPVMTMWAWIPMILAETSTGVWLLFKAVRYQTEKV